jgi:hypothetical protein
LPQKLRTPGWREAPKHLVGDELWQFLKHQETAQALETMILTYRNYDISVTFLAQLAEHFQSAVGQTIKGIADTVHFLKQNPTEFPKIADVFNLSPDERALFNQQRIDKYPDYSSSYLRMGSLPGGLVHAVSDQITTLLMTQEDRAIYHEREAVLDAHPGQEHDAIMRWLHTKGALTYA